MGESEILQKTYELFQKSSDAIDKVKEDIGKIQLETVHIPEIRTKVASIDKCLSSLKMDFNVHKTNTDNDIGNLKISMGITDTNIKGKIRTLLIIVSFISSAITILVTLGSLLLLGKL